MRKLTIALLPLVLVACHTKHAVVSSSSPSADSSAVSSAVPSALTADDFAYALMAQSAGEKDNTFLSPASAAMALSMLTPGAQGQSLAELQSVVPSVSVQQTEFLKVAAAIWINDDIKVYPSFLKANADAEVYEGKITANKVNRWASEHTNGKIKEVLQEPLPLLKVVLTNALYFKAEWQAPFDGYATRQEPFYGASATHDVDMMHQTERFAYMEDSLMQVVRLRYHYPATYCMDIILPREGKSWDEVLPALPKVQMEEAEYEKVRLALPKVKMSYEKQLNDYLKLMGLRTVFTRSADFSRLSSTPLFVDFVKQNTFLAIDENGTEAAAVTTIGLAKNAFHPAPEKIYNMTVNRPFALLIRETESNQILFYGVIKDL
ncbi:MAG: hypothetical protein MJZ75_06900 [Paludibacteraceae bacterium]|nr:hypothetical protein [Paludibacteraceae bacterium]